MRFTIPACVVVAASVLVNSPLQAQVDYYLGTLDVETVNPAFQTATSTHVKNHIDFDDDGFDIEGDEYTPIPSDYYSDLGITLLNLDARSVSNPAWTHSAPVGAWQTGFPGNPPTYSLLFSPPVASVGYFMNDVEQPYTATVHRGAESQNFDIPFQGSAVFTRFHGFVSPTNSIDRIDFTSADFHTIDDIQFGYLPEPSSICAVFSLAIAAAARRRSSSR